MSNQHQHLRWKEHGVEHIYDAHIFRVMKADREAADGRRHQFVYLDSPNWANIIAPIIRDDGVECLVMVRQYRQGGGFVTLELPGGVVDDGEDPKLAALRELEEETGYTATDALFLGAVNPNPAFMNNEALTFLAQDVKPRSSQSLDQNEIVDAELVPVSEIIAGERQEFLNHAIMVSALYWYREHLEGRWPGRDTPPKAP